MEDVDKNKSVGYTVDENGGFTESSVDSTKCFAEIFKTEHGNTIFYVKTNSNGELLDPWENKDELENIDRRRDRKVWELKKVSEDCFDSYVLFLQTKSKAQLLHANRRLRNG